MHNLKITPIIVGVALSYLLLASCSRIPPSPGQTEEPGPTRLLITDKPTPSNEPGTTEIFEATQTSPIEQKIQPTQVITSPRTNTSVPAEEAITADVISVRVSGETGTYIFTVEVRSPDLGCEQYADWWEVVNEDGNLIYRRILTHSHVTEQPFTRSGGPVEIENDTIVLIRAHMNNSGYGGVAMRGSVRDGFTAEELSPEFSSHLVEIHPLPEGCDF